MKTAETMSEPEFQARIAARNAPLPGKDEVIHIPSERRHEIIREVCVKYGLTKDELLRRTHARHISHPRQEAMVRLRMECGLSFPRIGALFNLHHTTVLYAVRKHRRAAS